MLFLSTGMGLGNRIQGVGQFSWQGGHSSDWCVLHLSHWAIIAFLFDKCVCRVIYFWRVHLLITWSILVNFTDVQLVLAFHRTWTHLFDLLATLLRKASAVSLLLITSTLAEHWEAVIGKKIIEWLGLSSNKNKISLYSQLNV